jgi:Domain of unknown function (DUF6647)
MQLIRFSRVLAGTLFLVAATLLQTLFPALAQPTISVDLRVTDSAGGSPFGDAAFINFDEEGVPISSECTGRPKATGRMTDQNIFPIGRDIYPKDASHGKSHQSALMHWVVNYLDISEHFDLPCIEYRSPGLIAVVRHKNSHSKRLEMGAYDDAVNTIYLPEGWTGKTSAETSILVHQMVYHVQNLAGRTYECSWERERLAYSAQEGWLRLHRSNLWDAFAIDRTIFLLSADYIC